MHVRHTLVPMAITLALLLATPLLAAATPADPPCYIKKSTWLDSMLASRSAILKTLDHPKGFHTFASPILRSHQPAYHLRLPIAGLKELHLHVIGAPEEIRGYANWANATLIDKAGKSTRVSAIKSIKTIAGQSSTDANLESGVFGPLKIAGQPFPHGLHVAANSKLIVPLDKDYELFEAFLGVDDWVVRYPSVAGPGGAVRFIAASPSGAAREDLWDLLARDFADETSRRQMKWTRFDQILDSDWADLSALAKHYAQASFRVPALVEQANALAATTTSDSDLQKVVALYHHSRQLDDTLARAKSLSFRALRMAIEDLADTFKDQYPNAPTYLAQLNTIQQSLATLLSHANARNLNDLTAIANLVSEFDHLQSQATLANPLLDFDKLIVLRRTPDGDPRMAIGTGYGVGEFIGLPRQTSKHSPGIDRYFDWDNEIATLSPVSPKGNLTTLYKPAEPNLINDIDLHFDADRLAFSMPGSHKKWHVWEINADGSNLRQLTPPDHPDVHYYDPCYLPNDKLAFLSTACLQGVPCNAGVIVGMMYTMNANGSDIRQLCFEQDHDYYPVVMNDGRIMYSRWDYTDTPHVWNRMLFTCNPDGTEQMEYYKANGYWPNAIFYAKPIPNHPTKVVGIVTGHHVGRIGELTVFDPVKSRHEADGVVQQIPRYGQKVVPLIQDKLTEFSWPKFLHPYPLSEKYFLVAAKPTPDSLWGIYLVDVFDNMTLIKEVDRQALLEPIPLRKTKKPPVIPDRVKPDAKDALVYMMNVYDGIPMKGIPKGTVKKLRLFAYHFGYQRLAGIDHRVGADGPWEVKRVLGTVDVEADGSAKFVVPAKTPFTLQPLDADGKAVALMRTWMTAMPGETVSCVGCHDNRNGSPPVYQTIAQNKPPQEIKPWYGPTRGFSFKREVQPVLDKYCISCHNNQPYNGQKLADLRADQGYYICYKGGDPKPTIERAPKDQLIGKYGGIFEPSYIALRRLVRVGGLESDLHFLPPMEFHADTTELFQMLRKGHYNVQLDTEAWDRLATWIDLNAPCHGTWSEFCKIANDQHQRRQLLQRLFGGLEQDPEVIPDPPAAKIDPILPPPMPPRAQALKCDAWPFAADEAKNRQSALSQTTRSIDLGNNITLDLVRIPPGKFIMGSVDGAPDESPQSIVAIAHPYWIAKCEITNEQFARFDPTHNSRFEHRSSWIFADDYLGWRLNNPQQPVVRVSWNEAIAFCQWLTQKTGLPFALPTEAQWEYAARAGSATPFPFGAVDSDFSKHANLADYNIRDWAYEGWRPKSPDIFPRDDRFNDGHFVTAPIASYQPNPFGLHDTHGNASEWTRSLYQPYPYKDDTRNALTTAGQRTVRGGSWFDRPYRATSSFRLPYPPHQKIYNVTFRVIIEDQTTLTKTAAR